METYKAEDLVEKMGVPMLLVGRDRFEGLKTMADLYGYAKATIEHNSEFSLKKFLLTAYRFDLGICFLSDTLLDAHDKSGAIYLEKKNDNWVFSWEPILF